RGNCGDLSAFCGTGIMRKVTNLRNVSVIDQLESRLLLSVSRDSNGWTVVNPSTDTQVIYVSSSQGNDANTGLSTVSPVKTLVKGLSLLRDGMPDWLLLRRGDTFNATSDFPVWLTKSGRSPDEPLLVSAYGQGNRPLLETGLEYGIRTMNGAVNSVAIIGLSFHGSSADASGVFWLSPTSNMLIEDCSFDNFGNGMVFEGNGRRANVSIRRSVITNSAAQGMLVAETD